MYSQLLSLKTTSISNTFMYSHFVFLKMALFCILILPTIKVIANIYMNNLFVSIKIIFFSKLMLALVTVTFNTLMNIMCMYL